MIYLTSDLHFGHQRPFLYGPRGFKTIEEHDAAIINNWNSIVTPEDTVYILGDVMLNDNEHGMECLRQLAGKKILISGNHDTDARLDLITYDFEAHIEWMGYAMPLKYKKFRFYLSHYPTLTANMDDGKSLREHTINLCGHSHTSDKFADWDKGLIYHVELDAHDNKPVSIEEIISDLREKYNESCDRI